jgi:hypothetical protein
MDIDRRWDVFFFSRCFFDVAAAAGPSEQVRATFPAFAPENPRNEFPGVP